MRQRAYAVKSIAIAIGTSEIAAMAPIDNTSLEQHVEFGDLPKTATGKIQKFVLREREWAGQEKRIH